MMILVHNDLRFTYTFLMSMSLLFIHVMTAMLFSPLLHFEYYRTAMFSNGGLVMW